MRRSCILAHVLAVLVILGLVMASFGALAAVCPTTGRHLGEAYAGDYLPSAAADLSMRGDSALAELAQWYGYALGQARERAKRGSQTAACLCALDQYMQDQAKPRGLLGRYVAGYMGAPPMGRLAGLIQPDRLMAMLDTLVQERAIGGSGSNNGSGGGSEGGTGRGGDIDGFVGTWDLVDLAILEDGEYVPNVRFSYIGFSLFHGSFFKTPEVFTDRQISSTQISRFNLFRAIEKKEPDIEQLSKTIQADVSISFRLLSYLNSAAFGFSKNIETVHKAITLMGWKPLKKWLRVIILSDMGRKDSDATDLIFLSAQRGKFLESIAIDHDFWGFNPDTIVF